MLQPATTPRWMRLFLVEGWRQGFAPVVPAVGLPAPGPLQSGLQWGPVRL